MQRLSGKRIIVPLDVQHQKTEEPRSFSVQEEISLQQRSTFDKLQQKRNLTPPAFVDRLRNWCYPLLMVLPKAKVKYRTEILNNWEAVPGHPIIFAANHSAFPDTPISLKAIGQHSYLLMGKQNLAFEDQLFFWLNGVIWVDRKKREDMVASKQGIQAYLAQDHSVLWFPEATWNLTDNLLMLPMKWGIIDVAQQAGAQIIPMALEYDREKMVCRVQFAKPMVGAALQDKAEAIRALRDTMATMRWEMMEKYPVIRRCDADLERLRTEIFQALDEYPPLDWAYESSCIYNYPAEDVFAPIQQLTPCRKNAFLYSKQLKG